MIETRQAVEHIDEILSVPGIDAIYIGPADLSVSFGLAPGLDQTDPAFTDALPIPPSPTPSPPWWRRADDMVSSPASTPRPRSPPLAMPPASG